MAEAVYVLCGLTSLVCALLLLRGYRQTHAPLLFWSSCCFVGLTIANALVFVDLVLVPQVDLRAIRSGTALIGLLLLAFGLVWEKK